MFGGKWILKKIFEPRSGEKNFFRPYTGQGGHKPGKHGKPGKFREFEKLSISQGKLGEILIFVEKPGNSGKM